LGNGTSLIIMIGILTRLPSAFLGELSLKSVRNGDILIFIIEIAILIAIVMGCILLIQGVRKVPVNYAKQIVGNRQFGGARQFLPLKVNGAGVMPIIFAQAIIFIPTLFTLGKSNGMSAALTDHRNFWYMLIYSAVVIGFTFLYTALIFNPKQIADNLKQNNGFIPGVKPGQATADYIGSIMDKITLPGAVLLALVGILPGIAQRFGVSQGFSTFFGGTSLLIMVGVILDTLQQIETQLMMRNYDTLMKSGRIQGRQTTSAVQM
jgi:preprotein translocase subunit SecY